MSSKNVSGRDSQNQSAPNPVYLEDIPRSEAQKRLREALVDAGLWRVLGSDIIPLDPAAVGRVTADPVWALISSPNYHAAAMDGFAVKSDSTVGAAPHNPVRISAGQARAPTGTTAAQYVDTGDPLPAWADAVI